MNNFPSLLPPINAFSETFAISLYLSRFNPYFSSYKPTLHDAIIKIIK